MLFNSVIFLVFLVIVFSLYWLIPSKHRNLFLLIASYYFYYSFNPWFLLLLIGTSCLDYFLAKQISITQHSSKRKLILAVSLISNLGILFVFKYFVFFYNAVGSNLNQDMILAKLVIPVGLSFYTFQSISYTIDVYRNKYKANDSLLNFLLYVSFFPHMVAGPIVRHHQLMPQLNSTHFFREIQWVSAAKLIIWGYFKKMVVADNLSLLIDPIFNTQSFTLSGIEYLLAGFLFLIQLYADFSGYSDIAMSVAKLFNINLVINWKRPLLSSSISDYWKRHHISLTNWFKDYLYVSLGGNRVNKYRWAINIMLVFAISGLWHGSNYTFIVWGLLNGLFYLFEKAFDGFNFKLPYILKWLYTISLISLFFIAFRANSINDLNTIYKTIFSNFNLTNNAFEILLIRNKIYYPIMAFILVFLFTKEIQEEWNIIKHSKIKDTFLIPTFYIFTLFLIFALGNFNANSFIYFQF